MCRSSRSWRSTATSSSSSATTRPRGCGPSSPSTTPRSGLRLAAAGCTPTPPEDEAIVDVLRLARGMTYKAAASGLNLGGGKSVIIGDPEHRQVRGALPLLRPLPRDSGRPLHRRRRRRHLDRRHGEHPHRDLPRRRRGRDPRRLGRPLALHRSGRPARDEGLRRGGIRRRLPGGPDGGGAGRSGTSASTCASYSTKKGPVSS